MKVKICGITRSVDVSKCEKSGANLIGFINIKRSNRRVGLKKIKRLLSALKDKSRSVMVLEPENPEEVIMKTKKTGIRIVQLHALSHNQIKYLKFIEGFHRNATERNIKVIRAIGISEESFDLSDGNELKMSLNKKKEIEGFARVCDALLFDYQIEGKSGGTGRHIPLKMVLESVKIVKDISNNIEIFLAGGLNSERIRNDKEILEKIIDYVDVNSGVEDAPGVKNPDRVDCLMKIKA